MLPHGLIKSKAIFMRQLASSFALVQSSSQVIFIILTSSFQNTTLTHKLEGPVLCWLLQQVWVKLSNQKGEKSDK